MNDTLNESSLLVVVLDTNPVWWGRNFDSPEKQLSLSKCVDAVMVFANSHLMMNHLNKLAIIASHSNASYFLYPKKQDANADTNVGGDVHDGKYEMFDHMNSRIKEEIKDLMLNGPNLDMETDSLIAGAVSIALCYIHRMEKEVGVGVKLSSRILFNAAFNSFGHIMVVNALTYAFLAFPHQYLCSYKVIKGSEDNPAQYMNFMNTVFTAQKLNVVMDACVLDNDSGLLQQAADITGGIYLKLPQPAGLLQYLLWVFLPDPSTRERLTLPQRVQVDYRAACFCHRNLVDIGFVCSVCLSIFCTFSPICSTCQTTFKIKGPPKIIRKRSKKAPS